MALKVEVVSRERRGGAPAIGVSEGVPCAQKRACIER